MPEIALQLITAGANVNSRDLDFEGAGEISPISYAVAMKRPEIIAALIDANADVNTPNNLTAKGYSTLPLFIAIRLHDVATAKQLLAAGADVKARDAKGSAPLHRAVLVRPDDRLVEMVTALLDAGAEPNAMRPKGGTPLHNLLFVGEDLQPATIQAVAVLFQRHGGDLNLPADFDGATLLDVARTKGNQAAAEILTQLGATCRNEC
jgi:ankyrin repeat protein